ncbi:hypothetical protein DFH27DRAFT_547939 [Peziza echinospora]|nr:hypothetical protein DFH27DRAFT_547939 [Peziza echinospora]
MSIHSRESMGTGDEDFSPTWPLSLDFGHEYSIDLETIVSEFEDQKEKLFFTPNSTPFSPFGSGNLFVQGIAAGANFEEAWADLENEDAILDYLTKTTSNASVRILVIPKANSWRELQITWESMESILTTLQVMPQFWNVLRTFGKKTTDEDESFGGIYQSDRSGFPELCYLVKHTEKKFDLKTPEVDSNNDAGASDPKYKWVNRGMGVYHQTKGIEGHDLTHTHTDTFILLNPSETVKKLLLALKEKNALTAERVHELIAMTMTTQWKNLILDWEEEVVIHTKKAILTGNKKGNVDTIQFDFADNQSLYSLRDKMLRLDSLLGINDGVFAGLQERFSGTKKNLNFDSIQQETKLQRVRLDNTLKRLEGCAALIRSIIDIRMTELQREDNRLSNETNAIAHRRNELLQEQALKDAKEARARNQIALEEQLKDTKNAQTFTTLAFVFIPATFAAQVLALEYITIDEHNKLHFKPGLYLFLILTVICIVISAGVWGAMVLIKKDEKVTDPNPKFSQGAGDEENGLLSSSGVDNLSWLPPSTSITPKAQ